MRRGEFYVTVYLGGFTLPMNFACILNFSCPEDECVLHNHMAERRIITNCHDAFGSGVLEHDVSNLKDTLPVSAVLGVVDPDGLLGVVRLVLVVLLHISTWQQKFCGSATSSEKVDQFCSPVGSGSTAPLISLIWPGMLKLDLLLEFLQY